MPRAKSSAKKKPAELTVRRSNRSRDAAIESAAKAIQRNDWSSVEVLRDEQDEFGIWHYEVLVQVNARKEKAG